jgi:hypothetical protein
VIPCDKLIFNFGSRFLCPVIMVRIQPAKQCFYYIYLENSAQSPVQPIKEGYLEAVPEDSLLISPHPGLPCGFLHQKAERLPPFTV